MQNRGRGEGVRISFAFAVTCATWRLYPQCAQSIAYTPVTTGVDVLHQHPYSGLRRLSVSVSRWQIPRSQKLTASLSSLCPLFRTPFLCFQQLAASFCKTPGVGGSLRPFSAARHFATRHFPHGYNACSACSTLLVRAVGSIAGFTHRHG